MRLLEKINWLVKIKPRKLYPRNLIHLQNLSLWQIMKILLTKFNTLMVYLSSPTDTVTPENLIFVYHFISLITLPTTEILTTIFSFLVPLFPHLKFGSRDAVH